jgi:excisionase family DNA binding protein
VIVQDSQQAPAVEPLLITMEEAARRLSVGRTLIYQQVRRGNLPSIRVGRCRRIALVDLERYVEQLREHASQHTFRYPR